MTSHDFRMWLEGFMAGRKEFSADDLELIRQKMSEVSDSLPYTVYPYTPYPHNPYTPYWTTTTSVSGTVSSTPGQNTTVGLSQDCTSTDYWHYHVDN